MGVVSSYGTKGSEPGVTMTERLYPWIAAKTGVLWCHGHGSGGLDAVDPTTIGLEIEAVVDAGFPVVSMDFGGPATWGNSTATGKMANAVTQLANIGALTSQIIVLAGSMGGLTALGSVLSGDLAATSVKAMGLIKGANNLVDLHDNNRGGYATDMEAAYGITGAWAGNATIAARDPSQHPASFRGFPIDIWYGTLDTIVVPSTVTGFATAVGSNVTTHPAAVDHAGLAATPADILGFVLAHA